MMKNKYIYKKPSLIPASLSKNNLFVVEEVSLLFAHLTKSTLRMDS